MIALQARLAITDRLAFIATKDGYAFLRPDEDLLDNEEGFMDVTTGFKDALVDDREAGLIVTPSLRYALPIGNDGVLPGNGRRRADPRRARRLVAGCGPRRCGSRCPDRDRWPQGQLLALLHPAPGSGLPGGLHSGPAISQRKDIFEQRWTWMLTYAF